MSSFAVVADLSCTYGCGPPRKNVDPQFNPIPTIVWASRNTAMTACVALSRAFRRRVPGKYELVACSHIFSRARIDVGICGGDLAICQAPFLSDYSIPRSEHIRSSGFECELRHVSPRIRAVSVVIFVPAQFVDERFLGCSYVFWPLGWSGVLHVESNPTVGKDCRSMWYVASGQRGCNRCSCETATVCSLRPFPEGPGPDLERIGSIDAYLTPPVLPLPTRPVYASGTKALRRSPPPSNCGASIHLLTLRLPPARARARAGGSKATHHGCSGKEISTARVAEAFWQLDCVLIFGAARSRDRHHTCPPGPRG